ncbi:MAG: TorF family putative porin [Gammaproteobacteria bacterium]|nr:TorF family putative porin [Gammaproteobacteria bacterium]MBU1415912.1 TorF family putative porin [Gammaproteobacteria bacterium]
MRKTIIASALIGTLVAPAIAMAEDASPFTGNMTIASEYIYRGIGQTNRKPALQGGFDYAHSSGAYVGIWGSNVSWLADVGGTSSSIEFDVYGGYRSTFADDFSYDVGVLTYNYPGTYPSGATDPDTTEVYGSIGWKWVSVKYSHVISDNIFGWAGPNGEKTDGSGYLEVNAGLDLGNGLGVNGHVGHQKIKNYGDASYTDWKIGGTYDIGYGVVGLAYVGTNAKGDAGEPYRNAFGKDLGSNRLVATFSKTF